MSKKSIASIATGITATAIIIAAAAMPFVGAAGVPGNNGTLKVHEQGTPAGTESNDPKVCVFNFEGYGFDKGQSGVIVISSQLNGKDKTGIKWVELPAANADGYSETVYVTVPNGHYKTTVYGKDVHGNPDYNKDLKAKSKVIKVQCDGANGTIDADDDATDSTDDANGNGQGNTPVLGATDTAQLPGTIPATGSGILGVAGGLGLAAAAYVGILRFRK
jgi:hypothetical protein